MKRFGNVTRKVNAILEVFGDGERLNGREIVGRLQKEGYHVNDAHLKMFIYYNMLYKYLRKEEVKGINQYSLIT